MASKSGSGGGLLNTVGNKISVRNLKKLEGTLSTSEIEYIREASEKQGWNINYDYKNEILHIRDPKDKKAHFMFHKEFLTDEKFNLSGTQNSNYSLEDLFDYYNHLDPNLKGHATHFEFIEAQFTPDNRQILGSFDVQSNRILLNANNLLYSKKHPQSLEYTFQHESTHALDWEYRSSNSLKGMFSKHKAWKDVSDGKAPTQYAQMLKNQKVPNVIQRTENLAEVSAYTQLAKRYGEDNVLVPTSDGHLQKYSAWSKQKDIEPMVKLAREFVENPEKYVQQHLGKNEPIPLPLR